MHKTSIRIFISRACLSLFQNFLFVESFSDNKYAYDKEHFMLGKNKPKLIDQAKDLISGMNISCRYNAILLNIRVIFFEAIRVDF